MKISNKQLKILSSIILLFAVSIGAYTSYFNERHEKDPHSYGDWVAVALMFVALILLMPWIKEKN